MLDCMAGKNPHTNENRWYYHSIPSTVCIFLINIWLRFLKLLSGEIIENRKMRAQRACQAFNAHLELPAGSANPDLGFVGFQGPSPEKSFGVMVTILIKGISNYMFRKIIIRHPNPDARCHTCWGRAPRKITQTLLPILQTGFKLNQWGGSYICM